MPNLQCKVPIYYFRPALLEKWIGPQGETLQGGLLLCLSMTLLNVGISSELETHSPSKISLIRFVHIEQPLIYTMSFKDFDAAKFLSSKMPTAGWCFSGKVVEKLFSWGKHVYSLPFFPCSGQWRGEWERQSEEKENRVDLPSACSHNKLHSEWADTLLKYAWVMSQW